MHPQYIKEAEQRRRQAATSQVAVQVLQFSEQLRKAGEIQELLGVKHRQTFRENYPDVFLDKGWLTRTISDKLQSRLQRY
jgi:ATP-dependent DNA helicase RecG